MLKPGAAEGTKLSAQHHPADNAAKYITRRMEVFKKGRTNTPETLNFRDLLIGARTEGHCCRPLDGPQLGVAKS